MGQLDPDELLIKIPEWLAEENIGYVDGGTPTEFVGRIERETEKAILFADSASAHPLMRFAHRITNLEEGSDHADPDRVYSITTDYQRDPLTDLPPHQYQ